LGERVVRDRIADLAERHDLLLLDARVGLGLHGGEDLAGGFGVLILPALREAASRTSALASANARASSGTASCGGTSPRRWRGDAHGEVLRVERVAGPVDRCLGEDLRIEPTIASRAAAAAIRTGQ